MLPARVPAYHGPMSALVDPTLAADLARGTPSQKVDALFAYMRRRGQSFYDESVTQLQHALQCARQAELAAADPVQVAAALLHDLGHFLVDEHDEQADYLTEDLLHEEVGASYLQPYFIERGSTPWAAECRSNRRRSRCRQAAPVFDLGVRYIGVCCGGTPAHIRQIAEELGRTPPLPSILLT